MSHVGVLRCLWFVAVAALLPLARAEAAVFDITAYGACPACSAAANNAAIVNALAAMPAAGGSLYIPAGAYNVNGGIAVTKEIAIYGDGGGSVLNNVTTSHTFVVTTVRGVHFRDFGLQHSGGAPAAGASVYVDPGPGLENGESKFLNMKFFNSYEGLHFERASTFRVQGSVFVGHQSAGVFVRNANNADSGDSVIAASHFQSNGVANFQGVVWRSSGGLKLSGNKFSGGLKCVDVLAENGVDTVIFIMTGNSCEDFTVHGVQVQQVGTGKLTGIQIANNEFGLWNAAAFSGLTIDSPSARDITVKGNVFYLLPGSAQAGVYLINGADTVVEGNLFSTRGGAAGSTLGLYATATYGNAVFAGNHSAGIATPFNTSTSNLRLETLDIPRTKAQLDALAALPAAGSLMYCSDCTRTAPCGAGGTGAHMKIFGGVKVCD